MPKQPEEQLELLSRQDIRTMTKDMARLREEESKGERERILQLQKEQKQKKQQGALATSVPLQTTLGPASSAGNPSGLVRQGELPKPPSRAKKALIRIVISLLLLFVAFNAIALAYSFWKNQGVV